MSRWFPFVSLGVAAFLLLLLPTALRPPPQRPDASAELSPEAPPDDSQSIVSEFRRGASATAGAAAGEVAGQSEAATGGVGVASAGPSGVAPPPARACPGGVGVPPRQTFSNYSAPCASTWPGDNGGATWKGVTGNEVRIALMEPTGNNSSEGTTGPVPDKPRSNESAEDRLWRVYQAYFNSTYQFWGRRLQLVMNAPPSDPAGQRAAVSDSDTVYKVFGAYANTTATVDELARRQLISMSTNNMATSVYTQHRPYAFGFGMDGDQLERHLVEYICNKLAGKPAVHAGDPNMQSKVRKFGFIVSNHDGWGSTEIQSTISPMLKQQCGVDDSVVFSGTWGDESTQAAVARVRLEGVTTVGLFTDPIIAGPITQEADSEAFSPEWLVTGMWMTDMAAIPILFNYSQNQWRHAFGIAAIENNRPLTEWDSYKAYKMIAPDSEPPLWHWWPFYALEQIANGIQMAGPHLTPQTFQEGLLKIGRRFPGQPFVGGGYGPGDWTYTDDVGEVWWDDTIQSSYFAPTLGNYRYVRCGQRDPLGGIVAEDTKAFAEGCAPRPGTAQPGT